jgi:hypothetical protein
VGRVKRDVLLDKNLTHLNFYPILFKLISFGGAMIQGTVSTVTELVSNSNAFSAG